MSNLGDNINDFFKFNVGMVSDRFDPDLGVGASGAVTSERKAELKALEDKMETEVDKFTKDPDTGKPILPEVVEQYDLAGEQKKSDIGELSTLIKTEQDKQAHKLYKMGVTHHGKFEQAKEDTSDLFRKKIEDVDTEYDVAGGNVEDLAHKLIGDIKTHVDNTRQKYESTGIRGSVYRTLFPKTTGASGTLRYDAAAIGEDLNPYDIIEDAYDYDYITGRKKDKGTT